MSRVRDGDRCGERIDHERSDHEGNILNALERFKRTWRFVRQWTARAVVVTWLVLLVGLTVAWMRSYRVRDTITRQQALESGNESTSTEIMFDSQWGLARFLGSHRSSDRFAFARWARGTIQWVRWNHSRNPAASSVPTTQSSMINRAGFSWEWNAIASGGDRRRYLRFSAPYWAIVLLLLSPVALVVPMWKRRRRTQRRQRGLCTACGYDLRASVDRCPECGTSIDAAKPSLITGTTP
jgi:hypothetical protein